MHQQLKIVHYHTPLFPSAKKAFPLSSPNSAKYIFLQQPLCPSTIYQNANICPGHETQEGDSLLEMNGTCLEEYIKGKAKRQCALAEEEVWVLIQTLVEAFICIENNRCQVTHLKEYCIRKLEGDKFEFLYHPLMQSQLEAAKSANYNWYDFYLSPEELSSQFINQKSIVFSLGAMLLNVCAHQDRKRKIYTEDRFDVDWIRIEEKLKLMKHYYSQELVDVVGNCLQLSHEHRLDYQELRCFVERKLDKIHKKKTHVISSMMELKPSQASYNLTLPRKSPKKKRKTEKSFHSKKSEDSIKISPKKEEPKREQSSNIDYRGTFGGHRHSEREEEYEEEPRKEPEKIENRELIKIQEPKEVQSRTETPKGFNKPLIDQKLQKENSEAQRLQLLRNSYGVNTPVPIPSFIQSLKYLEIDECLRPLEELKMMVGGPGVYIDGDLYFGRFVNGRRHGLGLEEFQNGEYYFGHFNEDLFHGEGLYLWSQEEYFFGHFELGQKVWGRLEGPVKYQGGFQNNRRHGEGTCWYPSGEIYTGEWLNGKKHNKGTIIEPSGNKFVGTWEKGKRRGQGYLETNHLRIAGTWKDEETVGQSLIEYKNGDTFIGILGPSLEKVEGEYISKSGRIFRGKFSDDQPEQGEMTYSNGEKYVGHLVNMKRHGFGTYYYSSGEIFEGLWRENSQVE